MYVNELDPHSRENLKHGKTVSADDFPADQRLLAELILEVASVAGFQVKANICSGGEWLSFKVFVPEED